MSSILVTALASRLAALAAAAVIASAVTLCTVTAVEASTQPICTFEQAFLPSYGNQPGRFDAEVEMHCPDYAHGDWSQGVQQSTNQASWSFVAATDGGQDPGRYQFASVSPAAGLLNWNYHWNVTAPCNPALVYRTWFHNNLTGRTQVSAPRRAC